MAMRMARVAVVHAASARGYARMIVDNIGAHRTDDLVFRADPLDPSRPRDLDALMTRDYGAVALLLSHDLELLPEVRERAAELAKNKLALGLRIDKPRPGWTDIIQASGINVARPKNPLAHGSEMESRVVCELFSSAILFYFLISNDPQRFFSMTQTLHYRQHQYRIGHVENDRFSATIKENDNSTKDLYDYKYNLSMPPIVFGQTALYEAIQGLSLLLTDKHLEKVYHDKKLIDELHDSLIDPFVMLKKIYYPLTTRRGYRTKELLHYISCFDHAQECLFTRNAEPQLLKITNALGEICNSLPWPTWQDLVNKYILLMGDTNAQLENNKDAQIEPGAWHLSCQNSNGLGLLAALKQKHIYQDMPIDDIWSSWILSRDPDFIDVMLTSTISAVYGSGEKEVSFGKEGKSGS